MARPMKVHEHPNRPDGKRVVSWYDPSNGWVVAIWNAEGHELSVDYVGHRSALAGALDLAATRDDVPDEPFEPGYAFGLDGKTKSQKGIMMAKPICPSCKSPFCKFKISR